MIHLAPITIDDITVMGIEVKLPKTTLLIVTTEKGYIMCGALDVELLNTRLKDRKIIAARATGVRTMDELLDAPLESVTHGAEELGIYAGTTGRNAIKMML